MLSRSLVSVQAPQHEAQSPLAMKHSPTPAVLPSGMLAVVVVVVGGVVVVVAGGVVVVVSSTDVTPNPRIDSKVRLRTRAIIRIMIVAKLGREKGRDWRREATGRHFPRGSAEFWCDHESAKREENECAWRLIFCKIDRWRSGATGGVSDSNNNNNNLIRGISCCAADRIYNILSTRSRFGPNISFGRHHRYEYNFSASACQPSPSTRAC